MLAFRGPSATAFARSFEEALTLWPTWKTSYVEALSPEGQDWILDLLLQESGGEPDLIETAYVENLLLGYTRPSLLSNPSGSLPWRLV